MQIEWYTLLYTLRIYYMWQKQVMAGLETVMENGRQVWIWGFDLSTILHILHAFKIHV